MAIPCSQESHYERALREAERIRLGEMRQTGSVGLYAQGLAVRELV